MRDSIAVDTVCEFTQVSTSVIHITFIHSKLNLAMHISICTGSTDIPTDHSSRRMSYFH